jgi:hypothetical protein
MTRLQSLHLDHFLAAELRPSLSFVLRCLERLHVSRCWGVDALLPELAHAPALRFLTLQPCCVEVNRGDHSSVPSISAVQQLPVAAPSLHCRILLRSFPSRQTNFEIERANAKKIHHQLTIKQRQMDAIAAARLTIQNDYQQKA